MHLTCFNCKQTWDVPAGHILGAKLKFGLGFKEHAFICPNCGAKNVVTKDEFEADTSKRHVPMTGTHPGTSAPTGHAQPGPGLVGKSGPEKPYIGAGPALRERHGVVLARSLHVRKDHSTHSETMAGLRKGDKVTIVSTWTDGENTWAQLGPDRWAAIEHNGEALIELTDE